MGMQSDRFDPAIQYEWPPHSIQIIATSAAFAELYNKAALKKNNQGGDEYILSKDLLDYLKTVEKYITQ